MALRVRCRMTWTCSTASVRGPTPCRVLADKIYRHSIGTEASRAAHDVCNPTGITRALAHKESSQYGVVPCRVQLVRQQTSGVAIYCHATDTDCNIAIFSSVPASPAASAVSWLA